MLLNCNGSLSRRGETQSVSNLFRRFCRLLGSSWRCKKAPRLIAGGEVRTIIKRPPLLSARHRRCPLECLPFELLHMILLEACTDGGRTGCSLSLVSKDIRTLSRAARFHSVSLLTPSLWKLRLFQEEYGKARNAAIQKNAPWTMPRVWHLCLLVDIPFLSDSLDVKPAKQDSQQPEYPLQQCFRNHLLDISRRRRQDMPSDELSTQMFQLEHDYRSSTVVRLLGCVAGDLFSLCVYQFPDHWVPKSEPEESEPGSKQPPCVPVSSFPSLRELWLGGKDKRDAPLFLPNTSFPALKRLHMRANLDTDILRWRLAAPRLDCLRRVTEPKLLTWAEGRETFMAITAHPIWREEGKQLTIVVPLERDTTLGWPRFTRWASLLRQFLAQAGRTVSFVPCYATQDVNWRVRKAMEGRRRRWPLARRDRWKPAAQEELFRRDWFARVDSICDGIYVQDFWAHFVEDDRAERRRIRESMGHLFSFEPTYYVAPLFIQPEGIC